MFKWILIALAAVAVGWFAIAQRNAVKTSYVNGLAAYTDLPGREFILERDCYIFKFKDRNTAWPLLANHATVPALPAEVTAKNIGADFPDVRILDVARVGERFKLISVRREQSRTNTTITFEILLVDEAERKYPRLDAFHLLDHSPEKNGLPPTFIETHVVPRVMR